MSKGFTTSYRIALLAGLVLAMFAGIEARLVWLHVVDRDEFLRSVGEARRQLIVDSARRGDILDAHGALLATSRSVIVLGVDPQSFRSEDRSKLPRLASLLGMPLADLVRTCTTKTRPAPAGTGAPAASPADGPVINLGPPAVADAGRGTDDAKKDDTELDEPDKEGNRPIRWAKLSDQLQESVYAQVEKLAVRGVYGSRVFRRDYPHNEMAAHIIGYVDRDEKPVAGIEHYADFYLRGENGWLESERDGRSHELAQFRSREVPASDGFNVSLSIDATIQRMAEDELAAVAAQYEPEKATIIVSDPQTGFIFALANYPSFDLNRFNNLPRADQARMRNIAVADEYEPGSVFKIVAVAGALNEGLVTTETEFDCTLEKIDYEGITRSLPREAEWDHFDHPLTVREILAKSSNKGAAQLAMALGDRRFYAYARAFGFGQKTGFPVGGEVTGKLKPPEKWDSLTITRMPMGQSVTASALQMQQAMGVIASGGLLLKPQIISQVRDAQGELVYTFGRVEVRRVISEQTARTMARLLTGVVSPEGNAPEAAVPGFEVAGKTGTANKLIPFELASGVMVPRYSDRHHVASFIGYFPATVRQRGDRQVAIAVIIDDADARCPGGIAYGAKVAAPVFKRLAERLIPYLDIRPKIDNEAPRALAMGGAP
ncbi:MAG: penicillin-binding protein 2 [Opitutaceae bacterium]|jgi:cell division protein FtsI/penicillin-binding protein 2